MRSGTALRAGSPAAIHTSLSTTRMAYWTMLALLPTALWGLAAFGPRAALVLAVSIASAYLTELAVSALLKKPMPRDGTALLTGLFIGLAMSPGIPLYIPIAAAVFAMGVVKATFGGLGANWMNPALAGLAFVYTAWPSATQEWLLPKSLTGIDGLSGATPLSIIKEAHSFAENGATILDTAGYHFSQIDVAVSTAMNDTVFGWFGIELPKGYIDLFLGNRPGAIGEISVFCLLAGSIVLIAKRIVRWEIPFASFFLFGALTWVFGISNDFTGLFQGDVLLAFSTGSFCLVAFYMATDPVTTPMNAIGRFSYGALFGVLAYGFRRFGARPEGTAFAVLILNCLVPLIDEASGAGLRLKVRRQSR